MILRTLVEARPGAPPGLENNTAPPVVPKGRAAISQRRMLYRDGGSLVLLRNHGWIFGEVRSAEREARALARQHRLPITPLDLRLITLGRRFPRNCSDWSRPHEGCFLVSI